MKNSLNTIFFLGLLVFSPAAFAQEVQKDHITIDKESRPASSVIIDVPYDEAREYYEDIMKEMYDISVKGNGFLSNKKTLTSEEVSMLAVSPKAIDLLASFEEVSKDKTRVKLTARQGYDLYFSESYEANSYTSLQSVLSNYAGKAVTMYQEAELEERQDRLKKVEKNRDKLVKDIEKNEKDIAKNLKENEKMEKEIAKLKNELEESKQAVEGAKEKIEITKDKLDG